MNTLSDGQEQELARLVELVMAAAKKVSKTSWWRSHAIKKAREQYGREIGIWTTRYSSNLSILPYEVLTYFERMSPGNPDPDGVAGLGSESLIRGLRAVLEHGDLSVRLAHILTAEKGGGHVALGTYVQAGLALEELGLLDPSFSVVEPGIESYFNRLLSDGAMTDGCCVVDALKRVINSALASG